MQACFLFSPNLVISTFKAREDALEWFWRETEEDPYSWYFPIWSHPIGGNQTPRRSPVVPASWYSPCCHPPPPHRGGRFCVRSHGAEVTDSMSVSRFRCERHCRCSSVLYVNQLPCHSYPCGVVHGGAEWKLLPTVSEPRRGCSSPSQAFR